MRKQWKGREERTQEIRGWVLVIIKKFAGIASLIMHMHYATFLYCVLRFKVVKTDVTHNLWVISNGSNEQFLICACYVYISHRINSSEFGMASTSSPSKKAESQNRSAAENSVPFVDIDKILDEIPSDRKGLRYTEGWDPNNLDEVCSRYNSLCSTVSHSINA